MNNNLKQRIEEIRAISTHSHHLKDDEFVEFDLERLLKRTYVDWCGAAMGDTSESREKYLEKVRYNSYFIWLSRSLKELYNIDQDMTLENWELYSDKINAAHKDRGWHKTILTGKCGYSRVILDAYWDPGSDNGHRDLFAPTFRVDPMFFGFSKDAFDHDHNNVFSMYGKEFDNLDAILDFAYRKINENVKGGSVCLKNAIAYDRTVKYEETTKENAKKVFKKRNASKEDIKNFQDYLFYEICRLAAELDVPIQCHTGLGCNDDTRAIAMREIIKKNPKTKFVIFHASFPWTSDILALLHNYPNVYADICWLPLLSPTAAVQTLHQLIEVGTSEKICWGCDTWTSEESYGARLAVNSVLSDVLEAKISNGYFSHSEALRMAENVLRNNAKELYKL